MWGYLRPLYSLSYWFNPAAMSFMPAAFWGLLGLMCLLFVAGLGLSFFYAKQIKDQDMRLAWRKAGNAMVWAGVTGLLLWFFNWQWIPYLSMRILWLVWLVVFVYMGWKIWRFVRVEIPQKRAKQAQHGEYDKWLPKPKK